MTLAHTRTFSLLAISPAAYREITHLLRALGPDYSSLFVTQNRGARNEEVVIDMHGIALQRRLHYFIPKELCGGDGSGR